MQLTPRESLLQFAHVFQMELFPRLEEELGTLSGSLELLVSAVALLPMDRLVGVRRARTGRRAKDRTALTIAFLAKAIFNLATTRDLIARLRVDDALRRVCGWRTVAALPHESKFSRAFAELAASQVPQHLHAAVVKATQQQRLIGHIARDSTAIEARERFPDKPRSGPPAGRRKKPKCPRRAKASERGTRIQQQRHQALDTMLAHLPRQCDIGAKTNSQGHQAYWRGYKLHLDVADGQIPISALLTSASVNDSQAAIPLMTMSSQRVTYLYDLMDSAYDADDILAHSRQLNHVPIATPHPRRGTKRVSPLTKIFPPRWTPELTWAQQDRFKERTMVERVYARLKDEFGASQVRVRGSAKVMAHLMFGVLALTVDQWLRLTG